MKEFKDFPEQRLTAELFAVIKSTLHPPKKKQGSANITDAFGGKLRKRARIIGSNVKGKGKGKNRREKKEKGKTEGNGSERIKYTPRW